MVRTCSSGALETNSSANLDQPVRLSCDEVQNPYFLSHADHPGAKLVPKILTSGENYSTWRRLMSIALLAKNKIEFVDGRLPRPTPDHDDYSAWCSCNSMVISWLLNSVSTEIADSVMYLDDAAAIWSKLNDRFHQNNGLRVFEVKLLLQALTQGENSVSTYFTRLKSLWGMVSEYRPLPVCTCGAVKTLLDYQEQDKVLEFLIGLNESYSGARSHILMQDPMPNINKVYSTIIQQECFQRLFSGNAQSGRPKVFCHHCGISGHTIAKCYKLHGYPPGHKIHGKGRFANRPSLKPGANFTEPNSSADLVSTLSPAQCQKIQDISSQTVDQPLVLSFTDNNSNVPNHIWIIDTSATHHICHDLSLFTQTFTSKSLSSVALANGKYADVSCVGTIVLSPAITLCGVLYVPDFHFNILSVSALTVSADCFFTFFGDHCVIQDTTRTHQIGKGELVGNLYYLVNSFPFE